MTKLILPPGKVLVSTQMQLYFVNELAGKGIINISAAIDPSDPKSVNTFGVVPDQHALITLTVGFLRWMEEIAQGRSDGKSVMALRKGRETFASHYPNASITHHRQIST